MHDFMLTPSGDLLFVEEKLKNDSVRLSFVLTDYSACKILFSINNSVTSNVEPGAIKIKFNIKEQLTTKNAAMAAGLNFARQACILRLKTQIGELQNRKTVGSKLEHIHHSFLYDEDNIRRTENIAKEAIYDLHPNAKVTAVPVAKHTGDGYRQAMNIKIYDDNFLVLDYFQD